MDFSEATDEADGVDGSIAPFSGVQEIRMVRVRARPSRSNAMSIPTLRRKVAARRTLPESTRGAAGQVLAQRTVSLTSPARAPRRSDAVPVHTVREAISERTAEPTGSASMTLSTASSRLLA
jgi:hypothetical protein